MRHLIKCAGACSLLLAAQSSFAWGAFSRWTTADRPQSDSICHAIRSTLSTRTGLAYEFNLVSGATTTFAVVENVTGRGKGADLWLQTANARGGALGPETQGFNIVPGSFIYLQITTPIATTMSRCAVQ